MSPVARVRSRSRNSVVGRPAVGPVAEAVGEPVPHLGGRRPDRPLEADTLCTVVGAGYGWPSSVSVAPARFEVMVMAAVFGNTSNDLVLVSPAESRTTRVMR